MQDISSDSTKLLTEKLALSRELATVKPELEHLRSQAGANDGLLTEKLSLQQELDAARAELTSEKRNLKRVLDRQGASSEHDAERETELEELRMELQKEKRDRQKSEKASQRAAEEQLEDLKKELAKAKTDREKTEKLAAQDSDGQLKELRKELAKEKREREKEAKSAAQRNDSSAEVAELTNTLTEERYAKKTVEAALVEARKKEESLEAELATLRQANDKDAKQATKAVTTQLDAAKRELAREKDEHEATNEKLNLFRDKLRTTKEKLKQTEADLLEAQQAVRPHSPAVNAKAHKNPRKRAAVQFDPDAAIGTPGDGGKAKRAKRASSVVGEKSTFSITPFLNRTADVMQDDANDGDEPMASIEADSPSAPKTKPTQKKPSTTVLAPASTNKIVRKPSATAKTKKPSVVMTLNTVAEEEDDDDDASAPAAAITTVLPKAQAVPKLKTKAPVPVLKPKSLTSFASFRDSSLPPQPLVVQNKKKRKLLGSAFGAKTIFDEDEEDAEARPIGLGAGKSTLGGQRALGGLAKLSGGFGRGSLLTGGFGGKTKGPIRVASDGFMFSPLKKDRKAMAAAAAGGV